MFTNFDKNWFARVETTPKQLKNLLPIFDLIIIIILLKYLIKIWSKLYVIESLKRNVVLATDWLQANRHKFITN